MEVPSLRSVSGWVVTFFNALLITHIRAGMLSRELLSHAWIRVEVFFRPASLLNSVFDWGFTSVAVIACCSVDFWTLYASAHRPISCINSPILSTCSIISSIPVSRPPSQTQFMVDSALRVVKVFLQIAVTSFFKQ